MPLDADQVPAALDRDTAHEDWLEGQPGTNPKLKRNAQTVADQMIAVEILSSSQCPGWN